MTACFDRISWPVSGDYYTSFSSGLIIYLVLLLLFYHPDSEARRVAKVSSIYMLEYLRFLVHQGITCKS